MAIKIGGVEPTNISFNGSQANYATLNGTIVWQRGSAIAFTVADTGASFSVSTTTVSWTPPSVGTLVGSPTYSNGQNLGTVSTNTNRTQYFTVTVPNDPQWTNANQNVTFSLSDIQEATALPTFSFSDGFVSNSFSVNYNGVASATLQGGATGLTMSPSSFQPVCSSVLRSSTVSFVVPSGYTNSNATLSNVESATQPSYSNPAISANMVVASGSLTNISNSGASGTHTVTITNPVAAGEWNIVYSGTGITPSVRSGCGDRTSLSWSVAANTGAARSGTITLYAGSNQSTVLDTLNWSQDTGIVSYSSSYDRGTSSSNVCNGIGSAALVYHSNDRSPISFGDAIYSNSSLSTSATAGWYSDGDEVGYWNGSAWSNTGFCGL
jgi:hypothetical protein